MRHGVVPWSFLPPCDHGGDCPALGPGVCPNKVWLQNNGNCREIAVMRAGFPSFETNKQNTDREYALNENVCTVCDAKIKEAMDSTDATAEQVCTSVG